MSQNKPIAITVKDVTYIINPDNITYVEFTDRSIKINFNDQTMLTFLAETMAEKVFKSIMSALAFLTI